MGGEKHSKPTRNGRTTGSPPRGRGKDWKENPRSGFGWDHPRVGGEKRKKSSRRCRWKGSPPRGRGKVSARLFVVVGVGITPAWAGKSFLTRCSFHFCWDHPRVGGEKFLLLHTIVFCPGSPPRGRGKAFDRQQSAGRRRITPAWAGKSEICTRVGMHEEDHPRVGGEKDNAEFREKIDQGSPPRGRGKVDTGSSVPGGIGITPAWAGKSEYYRRIYQTKGDHPRVGGEKWFLMNLSRKELGSPPRGRGKEMSLPSCIRWKGITPAWAGKSLRHPVRPCHCGDHPRVGGEKSHKRVARRKREGSPPRGRGKG